MFEKGVRLDTATLIVFPDPDIQLTNQMPRIHAGRVIEREGTNSYFEIHTL